jgi:hypothetical protein
MAVDWDVAKERTASFCSKFFSLILSILCALCTFIYLIGVIRLIGTRGATRLQVPHFIGLCFAVGSTVAYLVLHFIPRKAYRLMYALTALLVFSVVFVGHSMGVTAPTVDDCSGDILSTTRGAITDIANKTQNGDPKGDLGQSLGDCTDETIIFSASLVLVLTQTVAIFDVQRLLLDRVRAKTYGERFVEMGIK